MPAGASDHVSGGDTFVPLQVWIAGIEAFAANAVLVSANVPGVTLASASSVPPSLEASVAASVGASASPVDPSVPPLEPSAVDPPSPVVEPLLLPPPPSSLDEQAAASAIAIEREAHARECFIF